jgi:hypothetical protein
MITKNISNNQYNSAILNQYAPPSLSRKLFTLILGVRDLWNTYIRSNISFPIEKINWSSIAIVKNVPASVKNLATEKFQGSSLILAYKEVLEDGGRLEINSNFVTSNHNFSKETIKEEIKKSFTSSKSSIIGIPVVLKGPLFFADHIVTLVVNKDSNEIEFYDSKGLSLTDRGNSRIISSSDMQLLEFVEIIQEVFFENKPRPSIIEHLNRDQTDHHNCGIYVVNFLERKKEEIENPSGSKPSPLSLESANGDYRKTLIHNLHHHYTR